MPWFQLQPSDELAELALQGFDPVALDRSFSYHLHHCPYHLRLLRTQLMCSLELSDYSLTILLLCCHI
uniref:Uncharacterized protein n=1 Tax=Xiphophorus couchianus TaxID=32473 RepID=A0A3B5KQN7_9TELE